MALRKDTKPSSGFNKITISLASPEMILERSHGEVLKPETITIVHTSQNVMVYSVSESSVQ